MATAQEIRMGGGRRSGRLRAVLVSGLGILAAASASAQTAPSGAPPLAVDVGLAAEGKSLYRSACAPCHGNRGDGRGPAARGMDPPPRDLTGGAFKFRSTPSGTPPTGQDLFRTISRGVPGTWMPAWEGLLGERQRWAIVAYVKTLAPETEFAGSPLDLSDRPAAGATASEGRWVYLALGCAECHGRQGRGDGPSARTLADDDGRPTEPPDLTRPPGKGGTRSVDLYRTLRTGLGGTPMPAYEPHAVLFAGGARTDVASLAPGLPREELTALAGYLAGQPDAGTLDTLPGPALEELVERRLWSLVAYVESLRRTPGILHRLFVEDPNATSPGSP